MKKFKIHLLVLIIAVVAKSNAIASTTESPFSVKVGTEIYKEIYRERDSDGQRFMQEEASMLGLTLDAHYTFTAEHALRFTGRIARGDSTYTGSYQNGTYGDLVSAGQDRSMFDLRVLYENSTNWEYGPVKGFVGLGYRNLIDRLDQIGTGGYKRMNEIFYLNLQEKFILEINPSWRFSPEVGVNVLLRGRQHSDDLINTQNSGFGIEIAAPFETRFLGNKTLTLQPFFRFWQIGESDYVPIGNNYYVVEPANRTQEYGLNVSVGF